MLVQPLSALALALTLTGAAMSDDQRTRPIGPTESELSAFHLTPEVDYLGPTDTSATMRISGMGMFAASGFDLATTEWGLSQGLEEGNPAASQRGVRIATHVVGPMAVYWATERLQRDGKTKLALVLRITLMAAYSYAAIHNTHLIHSTP